jgi:hypothetical protein
MRWHRDRGPRCQERKGHSPFPCLSCLLCEPRAAGRKASCLRGMRYSLPFEPPAKEGMRYSPSFPKYEAASNPRSLGGMRLSLLFKQHSLPFRSRQGWGKDHSLLFEPFEGKGINHSPSFGSLETHRKRHSLRGKGSLLPSEPREREGTRHSLPFGRLAMGGMPHSPW